MFSERLPGLVQAAERIGTVPTAGSKVISRLLEKSIEPGGLDADECVELLNGTLDPRNRALILDFSAQYARPHASELLLLPPLYFASRCENACLYCDFSDKGTRLSPEEFRNEFRALLGLGYRSIELVSSQDPGLFVKRNRFSLDVQSYDIEPALEYFQTARHELDAAGGGMLTSNIPPVDRDSLARLKASGLDCYLLWAETFDTRQYARLHATGRPKANQAFRLDSFENAIDAGIEHIAGAFLKGLADWRKEEAVLYLFDRHLRQTRGQGFSIIGTPRLKGAFSQSALVRSHFVSDEDYELNLALDRLLFNGILWLQTRETPQFNRRLLDRYGGGVILTPDCSTAPGGYGEPAKGHAQFPVHRQDLFQAVAELQQGGFTVLFDWNSRTLSDFQRR